MNYYRIKPNRLSPKWAYAERAWGNLNYSHSEKEAYCPLCGREMLGAKWLGPYAFSLSSGEIPDFIFSARDVLVSERAKGALQKNLLCGIESFTECEVYRRDAKIETKFYLPKFAFSQKKAEFARSKNEKRATDKTLPRCSLCMVNEKNNENFYFDGTEEYDIFRIYERPYELFCTQKFLDFCEANGFTGINDCAKKINDGKVAFTKEEVFSIMGKYYGNAYWREAFELGYSEETLRLITEVLDKINALGYNFSNLHRLTDNEDIRFIPIVLEYFPRISMLNAFHCRAYYKYTPELIALFKNPEYVRYRPNISSAILACRHKKFIPQYLEIVNGEGYGEESDFIMQTLCLLKAKEALPRLIELYEKYPDIWRWDLLCYGWYFKDKSVLPYIEPYLESEDGEYRKMAKKAVEKLSAVK
ncbi:MAG: hypothetical protein IJW21_07400 [Clostridia bacterium]|nr:hypothetical protein [Clostridia bacterium]